jgi:hypothetical protein
VLVIPSIECDAAAQIVTAVQSVMRRRPPSLVVKATLRQLVHVGSWVSAQGWQPSDVDLVIVAGHAANYDPDQFEAFVSHALQTQFPQPNSWRTVTLASSAVPQDYSALPIGRSDVPRLDWRLWQQIHQQVNYSLDYGDYGIAHPNLARLRGLGEFLMPRPLRINGLAGKVFTTEGDRVSGWLRYAVAAVAAS